MSVAFLLLLPQLIAAGLATVDQVKSIITSFHPGMTDAELNVILAIIKTEADRRAALAAADQKPNA